MSGPKVVRIVTREEILAICRGHMARVNAALEDWTRVGQRNECIDTAAIAAARQRRDVLAGMIASERFMDLQKQAPLEEAFLREDLQTRLTKLAQEKALARSKEQREQDAAATILKQLKSRGHTVDRDLERRLERGDPGAASEGFQLLSLDAGKNSADLTLAKKLNDSAPATSFSSWLAQQDLQKDDPAIESIAVRLSELELLTHSDAVTNWRERLAEAREAPEARRHLLLDGLEVDTGRALTQARQREKLAAILRGLIAEAKATGLQISNALDSSEAVSIEAIEAQTTQISKLLQVYREQEAAAARRKAVLKGLADLGYEVTEGMSTSWAQSGRLVVKSATRPDYGAELTGVPGSERMQMRAVAFEAGGSSPDPSRDRDAETIWCGDVSTLQGNLAKLNGHFVIERSLPIGATPLKRIAVDQKSNAIGAEIPILKENTLRR